MLASPVILTVLTAISILLLAPCCVLFVQCLFSLWRTPPVQDSVGEELTIAVIIPAHNESEMIVKTLQSVRAQLRQEDRLLVVADNCTDETAALARQEGAVVIERQDFANVGKGFALQRGIEELSDHPPDVLVLIDADCQLEPMCLEALAGEAGRRSRPIQGCYLMLPPPNARTSDYISALAVLIKNRVRPRGMRNLRLPCLITGSGFAIPWSLLSKIQIASGNIVEDMQIAIDLALANAAPIYCDSAVLRSLLPTQRNVVRAQRTRWEHGHLATLRDQVPRLLVSFLRSGRLSLLAMALDISVPPLALLTVSVMAMLVACGGWAIVANAWLPLLVTATSFFLIASSVSIGWYVVGRTIVPAAKLMYTPLYIITKLPIYFQFLWKPQTTWVKTSREGTRIDPIEENHPRAHTGQPAPNRRISQ